MTKIFATFFIVLMYVLSLQTDSHFPRWFAFHVVAFLFLGFYFGKKYHPSLGLLITTTGLSGAQVFSGRWKYEELHLISQLDMSNMSAKATLAFLLLVFIGDQLKRKTLYSFLWAYASMIIASCLYSFYQYYYLKMHIEHSVGFLPNVSMGPNLAAVILPLFLWQKRYFSIIPVMIIVAHIYVFRSSMAWATVIMVVASTIFFMTSRNLRIYLAGGSVLVLGYLGRFIDGAWTSFLSIDRFQMWPIFISWWQTNADHYLGSGVGTFRHMGPTIQVQNNLHEGGYWLWAHSDFLQVIFETGLLGGFAALWLVIVCGVKLLSSKNYQIICIFLAYLTMCLGNYPLRLAEYSFLGMILIAISLKENHGHA